MVISMKKIILRKITTIELGRDSMKMIKIPMLKRITMTRDLVKPIPITNPHLLRVVKLS